MSAPSKKLVRLGTGGTALDGRTSGLLAALALSIETGRSFHWKGREGRDALKDEAVTLVELFVGLTEARSDGARAGSVELFFAPGQPRPGLHESDLGSRAPVLPVVHAAAVACAGSDEALQLRLGGVTHPAQECTFEESSSTWRHYVRLMGLDVSLKLERAGFAPRGGGEVHAVLHPARGSLSAPATETRGELEAVEIVSAAARLPGHVQQRQAARARSGVGLAGVEPVVHLVKLPAAGAGSTVAVTGLFGAVPLTVAAVSSRGKSAEAVGEEASAVFRLFLRHPGTVPPRLVAPLLLAATLSAEAAVLTTPLLLPGVEPVGKLVSAFTEREVEIRGKTGRPARIDLARKTA